MLLWDGHYGWERFHPFETAPPSHGGPGTLYGVFGDLRERVDLWVWSGPSEEVMGVMGADLRSMRRATRLGEYSFAHAKDVAEVHHARGGSALSPIEVVQPLQYGERHWFADWPNREIEPAPAGLYSVWEDERFIYVGMAGRTQGVDPEIVPTGDAPVAKPKNPLFSRLDAHARGARSGDQFSIYVCDRFVVPSLDPHQQRLIAEGSLKLDQMTKDYVRSHYTFRYITDLGGYKALHLEQLVQRGTLDAGKPFLNPKPASYTH